MKSACFFSHCCSGRLFQSFFAYFFALSCSSFGHCGAVEGDRMAKITETSDRRNVETKLIDSLVVFTFRFSSCGKLFSTFEGVWRM